MKQYLDLLQDILSNGTDKMDRTGTGTRAVFGRQIRFNMKDGFPAVTTKKLAWKGVVSELLFFLNGSSNIRRLAEIKSDNKSYDQLTEKEKFTIWNANYNKQGKELGYSNGYLGKIYGVQWRKQYEIDFSTCEILDNYKYDDTYEEKVFQKRNIVNNDIHCGEIYNSKNGKLIILEKVSPKDNYNGHTYYLVQFEGTNYCCEARYDCIKKGLIKDPYNKSIFGIGYFGEGNYYDTDSKTYKRLKNMWNHMLSRCYNKLDKNYKDYGEKRVTVCKRWHNFSNFCEDIETVYGFHKWIINDDYELDKDIFGANIYSPETCVLIPKKYNSRLSNKNIFKYHNKYYVGLKHLSEETGFSYSSLQKHLYEKFNTKYKDIEKITIPSGKHMAYKFSYVDQLQKVIDTIKTNPTDRRLLVNAWNPIDLPYMALPPCHYCFQFYCNGDKLSLMWNQRSVDSCIGLPFNIASYALLLHMVAKMTNRIPDELIASLGDTHIYLNHIEPVKLQLTRTPHALPTLEMPDIDWSLSLDEVLKQVKTSDFKLLNYVCDEAIKADMAA